MLTLVVCGQSSKGPLCQLLDSIYGTFLKYRIRNTPVYFICMVSVFLSTRVTSTLLCVISWNLKDLYACHIRLRIIKKCAMGGGVNVCAYFLTNCYEKYRGWGCQITVAT